MDDEKPSLPLSFAFFERMTEPERRPLLIKYTDRLDFYLKDGACQNWICLNQVASTPYSEISASTVLLPGETIISTESTCIRTLARTASAVPWSVGFASANLQNVSK